MSRNEDVYQSGWPPAIFALLAVLHVHTLLRFAYCLAKCPFISDSRRAKLNMAEMPIDFNSFPKSDEQNQVQPEQPT
jgi:hypothetical protein